MDPYNIDPQVNQHLLIAIQNYAKQKPKQLNYDSLLRNIKNYHLLEDEENTFTSGFSFNVIIKRN